MTKKSYKNDVAVLFLFFARPKQTEQVFAAIREARPSKLFLFQDGARKGRNDEANIQKCREIVENIDWECEVYRNYQEKNLGCDPSEYVSQKWMFSIVDKGIVLEDDDVPSQSFFPYCKELLDKYEYDQRINMICGMNNLGVSEDCPYDYFFTQSGSIWGWASWRRVIDEWTDDYAFLKDKYALDLLEMAMGKEKKELYVKHSTAHYKTGRAHYESILSANTFLNNRLNIVPKRNMISNIGIGDNGTHAAASLELIPRAVRKLFYMKTYELEFPLKHPKYIVNNTKFYDKVFSQLRGNWLTRFFRLRGIEVTLYKIFPFLR